MDTDKVSMQQPQLSFNESDFIVERQIQYIDMRMSIEAFNTIKKLCDMAKEGDADACYKLAGVMAVILDKNLN